ncbi:MAG TPA: PIN domain-containing protein [Candidatus Deferrimicrobium sp.]|nr:PIN domain-containing protein [Candidatus Deferrimicrobium sp.]
MHLADTSVLISAAHAGPSRDWLRDAATEARVALCDMVATEYLRGARDAAEYQAFEQSLRAYPWLRIEPADWDRAMNVSRQLAEISAGFHRSVPIPDLLIAAVAERHGAVLVHDDADYERIAAVTGQELLRLGRADAAI